MSFPECVNRCFLHHVVSLLLQLTHSTDIPTPQSTVILNKPIFNPYPTNVENMVSS